jgi:hypothetical protein
MPYLLIQDAIRNRFSLTAHYEAHVRFFSPHALGTDSGGTAILVAYQYAGGRPGGLSASGEWVCFCIDGLSAVQLNADKWIAGTVTAKPMHVLRRVDLAA